MTKSKEAPGKPGEPPTWATAAKTGVGTALHPASNVWFTLARGIVTEVFFPRVDRAGVKDLGLAVTDRTEFVSGEETDTDSEVHYLFPGVPAYRVVNTCKQGRYRIEKVIIADPDRSVLLMHVQFHPLRGKRDDYSLYVLLNPHLHNHGGDNSAWLETYKGVPLLFAKRAYSALALGCSVPWKKRSVGFAGVSDGRQDLARHKQMTWEYERAEGGNVVLTAEVDLDAGRGGFVLAVGLGEGPYEAALRTRASLARGFADAQADYVRGWSNWLHGLLPLQGAHRHRHDLYRISAAVMRIHESKNFPGAVVASLAVPWGFARGDKDQGGYHLVWPRDLVETIGGQLAAKAPGDAHRVLVYLQMTQQADGHWHQNMWLNGRECWTGTQLDETALAIVLYHLAEREQALVQGDGARFWPLVRQATRYLLLHGPCTPMDRWEEMAGYSPYTIATEIAALLAAADLAEKNDQPGLAGYFRDVADAWNGGLDSWIYVTGTELARKVGVEGYYVRMAPPGQAEKDHPAEGTVPLTNSKGKPPFPAALMVSPDALALTRFGVREANDPRMVNTVKVIDALLRTETPHGPIWHRYNEDGYGEHEDGSPFDGTGIGRAWPLLVGERAHYELAAGRKREAERLLAAMESFAGDSGLLPEQVWDAADIPERGLFFGRPSGSAMPLVWAHAEYVKLRRSLYEDKVFDCPPQAVRRYLRDGVKARHAFWSPHHRAAHVPAGLTLRVQLEAPARIRWSTDGGQTTRQVETHDMGLGLHFADLPTAGLAAGARVQFVVEGADTGVPEGKTFHARVAET